MSDIRKLVDRFLGWPLPKTFAPDCGVSFKRLNHPAAWPVGTNLFTADEAQQMLEYVIGTELADYRKALDTIIATSDDAEAVRIVHEAITPHTEWKAVDENTTLEIDTAAQPAAPSPTPWCEQLITRHAESAGLNELAQYYNELLDFARSLERLVHQQQEALRHVQACGIDEGLPGVGPHVSKSERRAREVTNECSAALAAHAALKEIERG